MGCVMVCDVWVIKEVMMDNGVCVLCVCAYCVCVYCVVFPGL